MNPDKPSIPQPKPGTRTNHSDGASMGAFFQAYVRPFLQWLWSVKFEAFWTIVGIITLFKLPALIGGVDSTAAALDPGVLSFIAVGVVTVLAGVFLFFGIIRLSLSSIVDEWWDNKGGGPTFKEDWIQTSPAVRLSLAIGLLMAVILAVAGVTIAAF